MNNKEKFAQARELDTSRGERSTLAYSATQAAEVFSLWADAHGDDEVVKREHLQLARGLNPEEALAERQESAPDPQPRGRGKGIQVYRRAS
jgi:hypothetical protein